MCSAAVSHARLGLVLYPLVGWSAMAMQAMHEAMQNMRAGGALTAAPRPFQVEMHSLIGHGELRALPAWSVPVSVRLAGMPTRGV